MPHGSNRPSLRQAKPRGRPQRRSPLSNSQPEPPVFTGGRFLLVGYAHYWDGPTLYLSTITDVPCHQFLRWTDKEPVMHNRSTDLGGFGFMTDPKFCFVEWNSVEQNEPGDTLVHTYEFGGWYPCLTRWWLFVATVELEKSASASCIFRDHYQDHQWVTSLGIYQEGVVLVGDVKLKAGPNIALTLVGAHNAIRIDEII